MNNRLVKQPNRATVAETAEIGAGISLMQKYDNDEGVVGVHDLERSPIGSSTVDFLPAVETVRID